MPDVEEKIYCLKRKRFFVAAGDARKHWGYDDVRQHWHFLEILIVGHSRRISR